MLIDHNEYAIIKLIGHSEMTYEEIIISHNGTIVTEGIKSKLGKMIRNCLLTYDVTNDTYKVTKAGYNDYVQTHNHWNFLLNGEQHGEI